MPANKSLQRAGDDKVHAPYRPASISGGGCAPYVRRAAAYVGRWAAEYSLAH